MKTGISKITCNIEGGKTSCNSFDKQTINHCKNCAHVKIEGSAWITQKEQSIIANVSGRSEQVCEHPPSEHRRDGFGVIICRLCGKII